MNYMKQIAQMLGVELDEEFYLEDVTDGGHYITYDNDKTVFKLSNSGILRKDKCMVGGWIDSTHPYLLRLLTGRYAIVKKPWKPKDKEIMYYIELNRSINQTWFNAKGGFTLMMYSLGNCFQTEEEITPQILEETWQKCYGKYFEEE